MTKKEKIIFMYYEEKLKVIEITNKIKTSQPYVTKIIQQDSRYNDEKNRRKEKSKIRQKDRNISYIKKARQKNKENEDRISASLETLHNQASVELSGRKTINNRAFKKWNSSIYHYHDKTKEFRVNDDFKDRISYAVPKKIKWD